MFNLQTQKGLRHQIQPDIFFFTETARVMQNELSPNYDCANER